MPQVPILLWLQLVTLALGILEEHQYCSIRYRRLCQGKGRHVACQFPNAGRGPSCRKYMQIKFSVELKHFITNFINRRRQRIAAGNEKVRGGLSLPKPQIMMLVEWDRELASLAQRLADQCNFIHDDCRATVRYPYAGQTVGEVRWRRSSESDELTAQRAIRRVLDAWWGERRRVQPKQLTSPFKLTSRGTVWGHFSQLSVWNLQAVGCGAVRHGSRMLLVCDFSHTNMLGQPTLVAGPQAPCPIHTARRARALYPLLCAPVRYHIPQGQEDLHADYGDDDSEDIDPDDDEDRVEVGEMPTMSSWAQNVDKPTTAKNYDKPTWARSDHKSSWNVKKPVYHQDTEDDEVPQKVRVEPSKKRVIVINPERDLEVPSETDKYQLLAEDDARRHWQTRKTYFERWREDQEKGEYIAPTTPPPTTPEESPPPIRPHEFDQLSSRVHATWDHSEPRHRWKQTRNRPRRPGANALLAYTSTATMQSRKPVVASLMLDKDDFAQLFEDTGFSLHWKKPST